MNQPTAKHQQEAREIVEGVFGKRGSSPVYQTAGRLLDELETKFAAALSSRDAEIREVLEGLATLRGYVHRRYAYGQTERCWCDVDDLQTPHMPACLAAQGLWERV